MKRMPKNDSRATPDGTGNVSDINLLKETVNVQAGRPAREPPVLSQLRGVRSAERKGSRDGIVVPDRRPERYIEPLEEELLPPVALISDFDPDAGQRRGGREAPPPSGRTGSPRSDAPRMDKPVETTAAPKPEGDKPKEGGGNRRRRGRRGGGGGGNNGVSAAPAAPKPVQSAGGASDGEKKRPRRRHRRGGGGGHKPNGGAEA